MAEVKNAFIKSKMNKDLDDRLLPNGEYRDALNVQVSKSESSDVGALENVLGNSVAKNFSAAVFLTTLSGGTGYSVSVNVPTTGAPVDGENAVINITEVSGGEITNYNFVSVGKGYSIGDIITVTTGGNNATLTVTQVADNIKCIGFFVDEFNNDIYSFFTDNTDNSSESTITYNNSANNFIFKYNTITGDTRALVRGAFLNFSTTSPIIGVNLLEELLFFTDSRNQPRKINVKLANPNANTSAPTYYVSEDQISVAKYNPYECIRVVKPSEQTGAVVLATTLTASSNTNILAVNSITGIQIGNGVIGTGVKTGTIVESINGNDITVSKIQDLASAANVKFVGLETSMYNVSTALLPDGTANPYYDASFGGDPDFLEDKFIRFSYRFQFDDGENSIFAPFTQPCFIPKQDGYFIGDDEKQAFSSTVVGFMENKVTKIQLQIPLPANATDLAGDTSPFKITAIDILYKESDGLAVQVAETIQVDDAFSTTTGANNIYEYTYESTKPFKTLPSKELIRVYDKIPVRAFSQEVISNRVVYGNFQDKHTPPATLDYQVAVSDKYVKSSPFSNKTIVEYPNSTVKQNRNYQVGIVLSDKFGRQSSTILSNNTSALTASGFGASTVFSPYQTTSDTAPAVWAGESLKILFNAVIPNTKNLLSGAPGLYNGDATSVNYNPLGWYSYKVVVQQKEQDYYNVYNAGAMKGNPQDVTQNLNTSYITLINDNINKVPRDLSEVGPLQKQFRSSVRLIGRVENTQYANTSVGNKQFYPGRLTDTTSSIEDLNSLFDVAAETTSAIPITSADNPFSPFYKAESDPLVSQITTTQPFGLVNTVGTTPNLYAPIENLTIFETEPDLSRLDFYFETSTSGLISELNVAVATDTGGAFGIDNFNLSQTEATGLAATVATNFYPTDITVSPINSTTMTLISVVDGANVTRTGEWVLNALGVVGGRNEYELVTNAYQYYGPGANTNESYTFTFAVTDNTDPAAPITNNVTTTGQLGNISPTIGAGTTQSIIVISGTTGVISTQTAVNGSNLSGGSSTANLTWTKVTGASNFTINSTTGQISNSSATAAGVYGVTIRVTDAGGASQNAILTITIGNAPVPNNFKNNVSTGSLVDGQAIIYYFTDPSSGNGFNNIDGPNNVNMTASNVLYNRNTANTPTSTLQNTQAYIYTTPSNKYLTKKQYKGDWFVGGNDAAFYVAVETENFVGTSTTSTAFAIEWRNKSATDSDWQQAYDINGQLVNMGQELDIVRVPSAGSTFQKVRHNSSGELTTVQLNAGSPESDGLQTDFQLQTTKGSSGSSNISYRIFAFNGKQANGSLTDGEYRITLGNFSGSQACYDLVSGCSFSTSGKYQKMNIGDASYGGANGSGAYEYSVTSANSNASCSSTGYTTYYAREWITKYVTQLYTDIAMTTKPTSFTNTYVRKFKRTGTNQEGTVDGAYLAPFDVNGFRDPTNPLNASVGCLSQTV